MGGQHNTRSSDGLRASANVRYAAREVAPDRLDPADRCAWAALEERSIESNAYLSPYFVLPALRHLDPGCAARIVFVERLSGASPTLVGVLVVRTVAGSPLLPVPHLTVYQSRHSYLGGPLLDRTCAVDAAGCLLDHLRRHRWSAAGVTWPRLNNDGPLADALRQAAGRRDMAWHEVGLKERAVLVPAMAGPDALQRALGKKFKEIERCRRRLSEMGELSWRLLRDNVDETAVEAFLRLEHAGWKADTGTSLRSRRDDEAFFKDVVAGFASEGRALFTELRLGDKVVASTSNFVSGAEGFAFKVGWDEEYRKYGIGILNEAEFVKEAPTLCADLRRLDSGSEPASFIEQLWPVRRTLSTAFTPFSAVGDLAWRLRQRVAQRRRGRDNGDAEVGAATVAADQVSSA